MEVTSTSADETRGFGERLGHLLQPGDFIALQGELGAGKTQFVQGVAKGLAVPADYRVTSPTYALLNMYPGRLPLYHFDLYRLSGASDLAELGFEEFFFGHGACLVEWAERLEDAGPEDYLTITFRYLAEEQRSLHFAAHGTRSSELLSELASGEKSFDPLAKSC